MKLFFLNRLEGNHHKLDANNWNLFYFKYSKPHASLLPVFIKSYFTQSLSLAVALSRSYLKLRHCPRLLIILKNVQCIVFIHEFLWSHSEQQLFREFYCIGRCTTWNISCRILLIMKEYIKLKFVKLWINWLTLQFYDSLTSCFCNIRRV